MLFNSYEFTLVFLPITLLLYFLLHQANMARMTVAMLVVASLFFYGWWNPAYLLLITASILINFTIGTQLVRSNHAGRKGRKPMLVAGLIFNVASIAYFKYATFIVDNVALLTGSDFTIEAIVLPLAISFFTFQQIAFLIDSYRGETKELDFLNYCLFVSFFPQLIAGPIVHHKEMMPQFRDVANRHPRVGNFAIGLTIFALGLFKKVVLADTAALYGSPVFDAAANGETIMFFQAWQGALSYTLQLYFDFSGYSDMAIGAARLFGIRLPINFNSPYRAKNIADFWRRWHMTLSRFLRDYIYIALGGNRKGPVRRYSNLMATMLIGGLWHGAGWTFVIWGGLHGLYLVLHQGWGWLRRGLLSALPDTGLWGSTTARALTLLSVIVGWVFFRATSFDAALSVLSGMAGLNGAALPYIFSSILPDSLVTGLNSLGVQFSTGGGQRFTEAWLVIISGSIICLFMPNTLQLVRRYRPAILEKSSQLAITRLVWRPSLGWSAITALLLITGILSLSRVSEFLYFQF